MVNLGMGEDHLVGRCEALRVPQQSTTSGGTRKASYRTTKSCPQRLEEVTEFTKTYSFNPHDLISRNSTDTVESRGIFRCYDDFCCMTDLSLPCQ
jgi:hypothetical protein